MDAVIPNGPPDPPPNPDDGSNRGRPTKLTDEVAIGICQAILDGLFRNQAAKIFRVCPRTLKRWLANGKRHPEGVYGTFRHLLLECEGQCERKAVAAIMRAGFDDDAKHLEWWLERKYPQRWSRYRGELADLKREMAELRKLLTDAPPEEAVT